MKNLIHQTPDERLAQSSQSSLSALDTNTKKVVENTDAIRQLHSLVKDKSIEIEGFTGVIKTLKRTKESNESQSEKVAEKIEQVKSANLVANKLLKDIRDKKIPEPKEFPKEMEVTIKGIKVITFKGDDGKTPKKGVDYYTPNEVEQIKKEITPKKGTDYNDGEAGKTPKKGVDYFTEKEIVQFKKEVTPKKGIDYRDGEDGYTPKKNVDYFDGKDAEPVDEKKLEKKIIKEVLKKIPDITQDTMNQYGIAVGGGGRSGWQVTTPLGTVDGSNTTFTVERSPIYVVADGIAYFEGAGYTYSGGTITMTSPPVSFIRSYQL